MNIYLDILKNKHCVFFGCAGRKEYWMFMLFNILVSILLNIIQAVLDIGARYLSFFYSLVVILPVLGVMAHRLHDTGAPGSGCWFAIDLSRLPLGSYFRQRTDITAE